MFWRVATFSQASPIEAILDKDEFTLEELLDEDDIIQECKSANARLVKYLNQKETIEKLIRYLAESPDDDDHFRYSFTACEIFCCELDDLFTTLMRDAELMAQLFSLLDMPAPLNSTLAGYFGRVVGSLLIKRPEETHTYLQSNRGLLAKLVGHIDTQSAVEVALRLVGADEVTNSMAARADLPDWLAETDFMQQLLDRLCDGPARSSKEEALQRAAHTNIATILVAIAHSQPSALAAQLTESSYLRRMLTHATSPGTDVLVPVLLVCIALLDPKQPGPPPITGGMGWGLMATQEMEPPAVDTATLRAAAAEIVPFLPKFTGLLDQGAALADAGAQREQRQTYGTLKPPLGRRRLTIVEFGKALLSTNLPIAVQAVMDSDFVPRVMQLFQDFPFNNILHSHVTQIFDSLLETLIPEADDDGASAGRSPTSTARGGASDMPDVVDFLVNTCNLLDWITAMPKLVDASTPHFQAAKVTPNMPLHAANGGHITEIALKLERIADHSGHEGLQSSLQMSADWQNYREHCLIPRLELQDAQAWAVGLPPKPDHMYPNVDEDDDGPGLRPEVVSAPDNGAFSFPSHNPSSDRYMEGDDDLSKDLMDDMDDDDGDVGGVGSSHSDVAEGSLGSHHIPRIDDSDSDEDAGSSDVYPTPSVGVGGAGAVGTVEEDDEVMLGEYAESGSPEPGPVQAADISDQATALERLSLSERGAAEASGAGSGDGQEYGAEVGANWWKLPEPELDDDDLP